MKNKFETDQQYPYLTAGMEGEIPFYEITWFSLALLALFFDGLAALDNYLSEDGTTTSGDETISPEDVYIPPGGKPIPI